MAHLIDIAKYLGKMLGVVYFPFRFGKTMKKASSEPCLHDAKGPKAPLSPPRKFEFGPKPVTPKKIPVTLQSPAKLPPPRAKATSPVKKAPADLRPAPAQSAPPAPWSFSPQNQQRARMPLNHAQTWNASPNVRQAPARPAVVARRG
jgi:hypothetical protein